jgi:uncharacterized Ntn-hydrolase superfamily protein
MKTVLASICFLVLMGCTALAQTGDVAAFSIVGRDSLTGDLGIAVKAQSFGAGAIVPHAKAGAGAVAAQGAADAAFGPQGIDLLEQGKGARQAVEMLLSADTGAVRRQVAIVDAQGKSFGYTGAACAPYAGQIIGDGYVVLGTMTAGENVLKAIARSFEISSGDLAERLMGALEAGEQASGRQRGRQSAALLVVRDGGGYGGFGDRMIDLRVDDDTVALGHLRKLFGTWQRIYLAGVQARSIEAFNANKNFAAAEELTRRMVTVLNAQIREHPDDPEVLGGVARVLATYNIDRQRAQRAAKLAPGNLRILDTLAECHFQSGNFDEAIAIESELVAKDPSSDDFWKQLKKFKEGKERQGR